MSGVRPWLRGLAAGAALGALLQLLPTDLLAASAVLCALALPIVLWIHLRMPAEEARVLLPLVFGAVAARVLVATLIAYAAPGDYFAVDQGQYQLIGRALADYWSGASPVPPPLHSKPGYYLWNALIYTIVGYVPLAVTFANAAISALTVIVAFRIARDLGGPVAGRWAAVFAAFFPSIVLWSSLNLKDAAAILAIVTMLRGAQRLQTGAWLMGAILLAGGVYALAQLRDYLVLIAVASTGLALVLPRMRGLSGAALVVAVVCVVGLAGAVPDSLEQLADGSTFETLDRHRRNLALGESAYHGDADVSSPRAALRFLPVGLAYFLLAPAPWQIIGSRQWLTLPEMLVWYALLPQVFYGLRSVWRRRQAAALPLVAFGLMATVSYALVEANLGTAYRHRAQVLIVYLLFAAIGLATRSERAPRRASWPAPVPA